MSLQGAWHLLVPNPLQTSPQLKMKACSQGTVQQDVVDKPLHIRSRYASVKIPFTTMVRKAKLEVYTRTRTRVNVSVVVSPQ